MEHITGLVHLYRHTPSTQAQAGAPAPAPAPGELPVSLMGGKVHAAEGGNPLPCTWVHGYRCMGRGVRASKSMTFSPVKLVRALHGAGPYDGRPCGLRTVDAAHRVRVCVRHQPGRHALCPHARSTYTANSQHVASPIRRWAAGLPLSWLAHRCAALMPAEATLNPTRPDLI